jgi:ABC-type branched-subunit amino acid transport system ATPase component
MTVDGAGAATLEGRDVNVHYQGVRAVDGVDLTLRQGRILGLIGPNGAGKTTFLHAVSGFAPLTAGTVLLDGRDVTGSSPADLARAGMARTFQDSRVFKGMTVSENVELGALGAGLRRRAARDRAREVLAQLGIDHLAGRWSGGLAVGDERRVGLARAVAMQPRFLLLDEPAAGLNEQESRELARAIRDLRDRLACGVLLVEHDMSVIFGVCDEIQVLESGKTIAFGPPEEIRGDRAVIEAYFGTRREG